MNVLISLRNKAFSLMEMLIVISVIAFLLAMTAPSIFSLLQSSQLSGQGAIVLNQLTLAQQTALSSNADVEVRFYKFKDTDNVNFEDRFRAFQFYQYDTYGRLAPISEIFRIQEPVIIHPEPEFSNLLSATKRNEDLSRDDKIEGLEIELTEVARDDLRRFAGGIEEVEYISFRFLPDGSTDLPKRIRPPWYFTLIEEQFLLAQEAGGSEQQEGGSSAPYNYYCIQIDPFNGSVREFRPGF